VEVLGLSTSLFPYTDVEKHDLVEKYLSSFDYDIFPTNEEQQSVIDAKNAKYMEFIDSCQFRKNVYQDLKNRSSDIIQNLKDLTIKYDTVIKETYEFQSQSDALISEENKYEALNKDIKSGLQYYELLYAFTKKLNNPNPNMVRRESFHTMLSQLDECIQFVNDNPGHKESETYARRFRQCLTRSLTLVKNYVTNSLKSIRDEITTRMNDTKVDSVTYEALLYTRFGADIEFLRPLCGELCKRAIDDVEYEGLLNDCYNFYFGIREKLLDAKIHKHIETSNIDKSKSLVELIQRNLSYFTKLYKDEYELFFKIFTTNNKNRFDSWLQHISEPLHDVLRNNVLHEQSISALCESATLLEKYYEYEDGEDAQYDNHSFDSHIEEPHSFEKDIDLGEIFQPISQDIQSRLVFRAQAYINENIIRFKPDSKTFQIGHRKASRPSNVPENADDASLTSPKKLGTDSSGLDNWYPPLKKGVSLLFKLYQLVSSQVFDDLAHNIVHDCIISLRDCHEICQQQMGKLDANLYFLKNLLMLKQQIQNFDIEYVNNETFLDFSGIGDIIGKLRNGAGVLNNAGFLEVVRESVPRVVNNMMDARVELQTELRNTVHIFTEDAVNQIIESIVNYDVETLDQDVLKLQENIEEAIPRIKENIDIYISDKQVVTTLIDGIQVRITRIMHFFFLSKNYILTEFHQELVIQSYENFYNKVSSNGGNIRNLIEVDSLIEFIGGVVSEIFKSDNDEDDRLNAFKLQRNGSYENDGNSDDNDLNVSD
jgi:hypothetical protein